MLKKKITFIYSNSAEKNLYMPIYEEAKIRGYEVKMTDNPQEKCEIGFYCQHVNYPRNSKFSLIMLHDSIQQSDDWPDIWYKEHWNKYDIGILPDKNWVNNYNKSSQFFYTNPRRGVYQIGWPKADSIIKYKNNINEIRKKYGIDNNKKTVLYAPSWENDNKQDDFVKATFNLNVNMLIKQFDYDKNTMPEFYDNVIKMKEKHKNIKNVIILPPETNIFEAIAVSDILISDGSSTMYEAAMLKVPSILVTNWLIPGPDHSTYPNNNYDFVIESKKEDLEKTINEILNDYEKYKNTITQYCDDNFLNIGCTSKKIMDIIDDCVNENEIRYKPLEKKAKQKLSLRKYLLTEFWAVSTYLFNKYFMKNKYLKKFSYKVVNFVHSKQII